ncbi:protein translocase subunit SecF [Angustibacter peucedani]
MFSFARFGNQLYTGERSIEVVRRQKLWYAISAVLLLLSLVGLLTRGLTLGLEFTGGSEFRISGVKTTSDLPGADAVHSVVPDADPKVAQVGNDSMRVQLDKISTEQGDQVRDALASAYGVTKDDVTVSFVGPSWGETVSKKALQGLVVFLLLVALVISVYFRTWKMAVAAIVALLHDLMITVGIYALVGFEVTPASVIGFLTILGYSLYDTVVVFDKVRENTDHITTQTRRTYSEAANLAVNQTLVRSINTSVVALLPVGSILFIGAFLLGAGTLKDLSLALFVGIATGTYSSVFIATPLLADLREREPEMRALAKRVLSRRNNAAVRETTRPRTGGTAVLERGADVQDDQDVQDDVEPQDAVVEPGRPPRATGPRNQPRRKNTRRRR